jgi:DNA-binding transcriptional regulator YiaG
MLIRLITFFVITCAIILKKSEARCMDFSAKVRSAREQMKISQEDLARALNVSYATINRWENAKTTPNRMARDVFAAFCEKNGVRLDEGECEK